MPHRPRILSSLLAAFLVVAVGTQAASCALDEVGTQPPDAVQACNDDSQCTSEDICMKGVCGPDKICAFEPRPIDEIPPQIPGDCTEVTCLADGTPSTTEDETDIEDDNESCTVDTCESGKPVHTPLDDDTPCTVGDTAGKCLAGVCTVECSAEKPCDDSNPCTEDTCNAEYGTCIFAPLDGLLTPGFVPIEGDCNQQICVNGVDTKITDDADLPDDGNPCTKDTCSGGVEMYSNVAGGTPCVLGMPPVCDGMGTCVECDVASDCTMLAPNDDCHVRSCTPDHKCELVNSPAGTVTSLQTAGDCMKTVCDGMGGTTTQVDDTDVPEDNNLCTQNVCTNGVPSNPPEAQGTACGGLTCNATGQCDGCGMVTDCPGQDDECKKRTCTAGQCGFTFAASGTVVSSGQTSGDCKEWRCDGMGNTVEVVDQSDLPNDGKDCTLDSCNAMGAPTYENAPLDNPCSQNGGSVCNGSGSCLKANADPCSADAECLNGLCIDAVCCSSTCATGCMACNVSGSEGMCVNVPPAQEDAPTCTGANSCDGMGGCKRNNGQPCGMAAECASGVCVDGVCCNEACGETCRSCNIAGSVGTCINVPKGQKDGTGNPACLGSGIECDGNGACKKLNGVTCAQPTECYSGYCVDGNCCGASCTEACRACTAAKKGSGGNGQCGPILAGTDPDNECPNGECDGTGMCTGNGLPNGSSCMMAGECTSGYCIDGVCCNAACLETCMSCNIMGSVGTCTNVPFDTVDNTGTMPCNAGYKCDGTGLCKGLLGKVCTSLDDCLGGTIGASGNCVDGFCCNNACTELCKACSNALTGGNNGTCGFVMAGTDPNNECANGNCDGAGMCAP